MKTYNQLTQQKRYHINVLLKTNYSISTIAKEVKVHRSTVYRELIRNRTSRSYNPEVAHERALLNKKYVRKKTKLTLEMKRFIRNKLKKSWSPEQTYGYCRKENIDMVSHETIYKYIAKNKKTWWKLASISTSGRQKAKKIWKLAARLNWKRPQRSFVDSGRPSFSI